MKELSLSQWLQLLVAAPRVVSRLRAALPTLIPLVEEVLAIIKELNLEEASTKPITPKEAVDKIRGKKAFTAEEKALFDRMSNIQ